MDNRVLPQRPTLGQLAQAKLHRPIHEASDFAVDKSRVLEALEQAGATGCTTRELMDRGGGMRPPNRIGELRNKDGIAIKTIPEGRGVYRYVLCKFLPEEKPRESDYMCRRRLEAEAAAPLFAGAVQP